MIDVWEHKEDCTGCTACQQACAHGAITMQRDAEGFLYPVTDADACTNCGLCEHVCPMLRADERPADESAPKVFALRHKDDAVLGESASGGAFTAIAEYVIKQGGVVVGCRHGKDMNVEHAFADTVEALRFMRGSKYVQSSLGDCFHAVRKQLQAGRLVLFTGTPCQVAGLNAFLHRPYPTLLTCDILCHGVASPALFSSFIRYAERVTHRQVADYRVRDKSLGWGHTLPRMDFRDGSHIKGGVAWLWAKAYGSTLAHRPVCYHCRFTSFRRPADLSIGDFWGIEKHHPHFIHPKGVSLVLVNSAKGQALLEAIRGAVLVRESTMEACVQQCLQQPVPRPVQRDKFWHDVQTLSFHRLCVSYFEWGFWNRFRKKLKSIVKRI